MPKLITSIIFLFLFHPGLMGQNILDAPVSFVEDSLSLEELLPKLTAQTGANFAYNKRKMPLKVKLPIIKKQQTLGKVLQHSFSNTTIEFRVAEKQIILSRRSIPLFTISGYVRDSASGEALIGANIFESSQYRGTSTNAYGFYTLTLPEGEYKITTSFVGYQEITDTVFLYQNFNKEIQLGTGSDLLEVVVVDSLLSQSNKVEQKQSAGTNKINTEEVEGSPSIMGEQDVMKIAQLLPGITFGVEGSSGLHVRGGSPDQNLILLDDVALYNVDHLFGLVSIFNSKAINSASIYKSGFPARYSGRLSSVMDVRMKDGNNQEIHGGLSMGIISGKLFLEGPIQKGKSSFLISGRRTWLDIIAASLQLGQNEFKANYGFHDFNAKINFELGKKDRLFLSVYSGRDRFFDKRNFNFTQVFVDTVGTNSINEGELKWGNKAYALRWNSVITPKLFMNATATFGTFSYGLKSFSSSEGNAADSTNTITNDLKIESKIKDIGLKVSFDYAPNTKRRWQAGFGYTLHDFTPGSLKQIYQSNGFETIIDKGASDVKVHESFVFLEGQYELTPELMLSSGFHLSLINTNQKTFWAPQLRFKLDYQYSDKSNLELSYSGMSQFVHLLTNATLGPPTDFWVPSTENVPPEYAHQLAIGSSHTLDKNWTVKGGIFYKRMDNLIEYEQGASVINSAAEWESSIERGKGWSYGSELLIKKTSGKTKGWLSYGLTWANRQFENINDGQAFPYKYDRRHNLNLNITHSYIGKKNRKKEINLSWVLSSGHLVTLPDEFYRAADGRVITSYSKRNNFRLPLYHRLDFSKTKYKPSKNGNLHTWSWGIFNIYGRANPFNFYIENFNSSSEKPRLVGQGLFSFPLPYIQYQFDF